MSDAAILFFLCLGVTLLSGIVFYQRFAFRTGTQAKLRQIHQKLKEILDMDSDERILVFTENRELMELAAQINRLLDNQGRVKADYRRSEIASKRMLSNISHDIKTPMTVILGYLEIMRLNGQATQEMLEKTEQERVQGGKGENGQHRSRCHQNFLNLGTHARSLDGKERLRVLHEYFNQDTMEPFRFSFRELSESGKSVKDCNPNMTISAKSRPRPPQN